jgi:DNA-binding response OmpR family regulator
MKTRVLLVEDDPEMRQVTRSVFERSGFKVSDAATAEEALADVAQNPPDLLVIDIQLPGISGIKLVEILRTQPKTAHLPMILLTALKSGADKVTGLKQGADDYVTKPYEPKELLARAEALLRRVGRAPAPSTSLSFEGLRMDLARHETYMDGKTVRLRRKEYDLLMLFLKHPGELLTRDRLTQHLWESDVIVTDNALSAQVKNLRAKLGRYGRRVQSLSGEGYRFDDEP